MDFTDLACNYGCLCRWKCLECVKYVKHVQWMMFANTSGVNIWSTWSMAQQQRFVQTIAHQETQGQKIYTHFDNCYLWPFFFFNSNWIMAAVWPSLMLSCDLQEKGVYFSCVDTFFFGLSVNIVHPYLLITHPFTLNSIGQLFFLFVCF